MWKSRLRGLRKLSVEGGAGGLEGTFTEVLVETNGSLTKKFYSEEKQRWGWCRVFLSDSFNFLFGTTVFWIYAKNHICCPFMSICFVG